MYIPYPAIGKRLMLVFIYMSDDGCVFLYLTPATCLPEKCGFPVN